MKNIAIIVAAGRGERAGACLPKQYVNIGGKPVLYWTVRALLAADEMDGVLCVIHPDDADLFEAVSELVGDKRLHLPVHGGDTRTASVRAGLRALAKNPPKNVLIHDGARPFPSVAVIRTVLDALDNADGAFAAIDVVDALWSTNGALMSVDRAGLKRAQTPQGFDYAKISAAYQAADSVASDDVAVAVAAGLAVVPVPGDAANFKVTMAEDFMRAERALARKPDIRVGNGYDVHAFAEGDHVVLNGVEIPHDRGLLGHSDADVAMHAITDAIYGALAEGDIGQWFPPSDPQWKGVASQVFLKHAVGRAAELGYEVCHVDCTIVAERPKIGPHVDTMKKRLSDIMGLDEARIGVKATTSERLGFTGREEGIAAQATATLMKC